MGCEQWKADDPEYKAAHKAWFTGLSDDEQRAIESIRGYGYIPMREQQLGIRSSASVGRELDALDGALARAPTPNETIMRGMRLKDDVAATYSAMTPGDVLTLECHQFASTDLGVAELYGLPVGGGKPTGVLWTIESRSGVVLGGPDAEVLLRQGSRLRLVSTSTDGKLLRQTWEEVFP